MSWFSDIMEMQNEEKRKYLVLFYKWIQENHPEVLEEWMKTSQIYSHCCVRRGT